MEPRVVASVVGGINKRSQATTPSYLFSISQDKMVLETTTQPEFFTATSAYSLAGVAMIGFTASTAANAFLPENAKWQDRATFVWLVSCS